MQFAGFARRLAAMRYLAKPSPSSMPDASPRAHFPITADLLHGTALLERSHLDFHGRACATLRSLSAGPDRGCFTGSDRAISVQGIHGRARYRPAQQVGIRVKLQERPFQFLLALVERPGEVITREELRQRLWPDGTFVDFDHSISSALNRLRSALGDSAAQPRYIETVGRRGYRFLYPVSKSPPDRTATPRLGSVSPRTFPRYLRVALPVGLTLIVLTATIALPVRRPAPPDRSEPIRALVVLPLTNLSSDPEQEYFSEGLTDELVTHLASLEGLRVISRASAMQYKNSRKPLRTIARELNVDGVLEGSVLKADGRVRITARLVEAASDHHVWAKSYERDHRDILDLQNEVTRDIAENIKLNLTAATRQRLAATRPIEPEAHEDCLRGRFYLAKRRPSEVKKAVVYFEKAIARDTRYARAYAGLADSHSVIRAYNLAPPSESIRHARAAALKALQLDEGLAEAHTSLDRADLRLGLAGCRTTVPARDPVGSQLRDRPPLACGAARLPWPFRRGLRPDRARATAGPALPDYRHRSRGDSVSLTRLRPCHCAGARRSRNGAELPAGALHLGVLARAEGIVRGSPRRSRTVARLG